MRRVLIGLATAMLLAGCSATPQTAPTGPPRAPTPSTLSPTATPSPSGTPITVDPCALAKESDIVASAGGKVTAQQHDQRNPSVPGCIWWLQDSKLGDGDLLVAVTDTGADADDLAAIRAASPQPVDVSGVGDGAFYDGSLGQLVLLQSGTLVTLASSGFVLDAADPPAAEIRSVLVALAGPVGASLAAL